MRRLNSIHHQTVWADKSDEEVWIAIKNDDKDAFAFLYEEHIEILYDYGMKLCSDDALVEESIQNLFIEIWDHRKNRSQVQNIRSYLIKSLRYKIFNQISRNKKAQFVALENYPEEITIVSPFEATIVNTELEMSRKRKIAIQVSKLPAQQREIINLLFYLEYSYEEISEIMGINIRSVYTLAWKAISRLRKSITEFVILIPLCLINLS